MLTNIKIPTNHTVVGFNPVKVFDQFWNEKTYYDPIFKRSLDLGSVVAEEDGKLYFLFKDNIGINTSGDHIAIVPFRYAAPSEIEKFKEELKSNKLMLKDNKIVKYEKTWWKPAYDPDRGFYPVELSTSDKDFEKFKSWDEAFDCKEYCTNWCNQINDTLNRNYPEIND